MSNDYAISYPPDFDDYEPLLRDKGVAPEIEVEIRGKVRIIEFYDPTRWAQNITLILRARPVVDAAKVCIIPTVDRDHIEAAVRFITLLDEIEEHVGLIVGSE